MKLKVSVLGAGSWGTTVANLLAKNLPTSLWARNPEVAEEINNQKTNNRYLPGIALSSRGALLACNSLKESLEDADLVLIGVPSQGVRKVLVDSQSFLKPSVPIISLTKGLERGTSLRMTEVIQAVLPDHPTGILTGPNLAFEVANGMAAAAVLAMHDNRLNDRLVNLFQTKRFRVYTNPDVIGCELSGAFKNVIALACGMADGMGAGNNTRAAFITRGLAEVTRLGLAMGGKVASFSGLAGIGDLIVTCTSQQSRNYYVGQQLGKGRSLVEITKDMHMVAEGVNTAKTMLLLGEKHGVELPIARQVNSVLSCNTGIYQAFAEYLKHHPGSENEPG